MIQLYQASGAGGFSILQDALAEDQRRRLFENAARLLVARNQARAAEILRSMPFRVVEATNHFNDEFSMLFAIVPLGEYERLRLGQSKPAEQTAFKKAAEVLTEIGPYIRFIAIELALEQYSAPTAQTNRGLKKSEVNRIACNYIGVPGGYLGNFSYRSHHDFYVELDLDIDPYKYVGTTRERFIQILSESAPDVQSRILEGVLDRFPVGSSELRTADKANEIRACIARLRSAPQTAPHSQSALAVPRSAVPAPAVPLSAPPRGERAVDFLIFAAMEEERDAVLSKLQKPRMLERDGADVHTYFEAYLTTNREDNAVYRVLVTSPANPGPIYAAITAAAAATRWSPKHVLVVGIAGGLKQEVALGDVIVAKSVSDYTVGKIHEDGRREERWESFHADPRLLNAANVFRTGWEDLVTEARPNKGTPTRHVGIVASGGDVIASKDVVATYQEDWPKLLGVEMEGGGVATALHHQPTRPRFLMIRGISDLADAEDNAASKKQWRAYARDVAAAYAIRFLQDGPVPAAGEERAMKRSQT